MKKYKLSYIFAVFFTVCFLITVKYFDEESATMFIILALTACGFAIYNFKLNR